MGRVATVAGLVAGALVGWVWTPWVAVTAGYAPWYAPLLFWLATGPVRWTRWVVAGAWEESHWQTDAVGDRGAAVGALQYHQRSATSAVRPAVAPDGTDGRRSAFWSAYYAPGLTVAHLDARDPSIGRQLYTYLLLRVPVVGYLTWRHSWRAGLPPAKLPALPATAQERQGFAVNAALAVACAAFLTTPTAAALYACRKTLRRWVRRVR